MTTRRVPRLRAAFSSIAVLGLLALASPAFAWHSWYASGRYEHSYSSDRSSDETVFGLDRALPNPQITPGALNPAVTQATIRETVCIPGYAASIRPPEEYTEQLKRRQLREYGYSDYRLSAYEEDHLVAIGLGGSPTSPLNEWPEPHNVQGGWGSDTKDQLEDRLHHMLCRGQISLAQAQQLIAHDWIAAYKQLISPTPIAPKRRRRHTESRWDR